METRKIICTSPIFEGEIYLEYDTATELLVKLDFTAAALSPQQLKFFHDNPLLSIAAINKLVTDGRKLKFTDKEITFAMFWQRYDDKISSSKKATLRRWDKMPKTEQHKAFNHIPKYFATLPQGTRKKYAETYLNSEIWNN